MTEHKTSLETDFLALSLRYHQKSATIYQSMLFMHKAKAVSVSIEELKVELDGFEKLLKPNSLDYDSYFLGLFLFALVSDLEIYLVDVVKALIRRFPKKVGTMQFKLSEILDSTYDELISEAAEDYLNRLMYKKPADYLGELAGILAIDQEPLSKPWPVFVEAKARRDLGAHNAWRINDIYVRKLSEVGLAASCDNQRLMVPDHQYLSNAITACDSLVDAIHDQLIVKYQGH